MVNRHLLTSKCLCPNSEKKSKKKKPAPEQPPDLPAAESEEEQQQEMTTTRQTTTKKRLASLKKQRYICQNNKLAECITLVCVKHPKSCLEPDFNIRKISNKLISVVIEVSCKNCNWTSKPFKMYESYDNKQFKAKNNPKKKNSGPRHSKLNCRLAAVIQNSSLGQGTAIHFLRALGVIAGTSDGLGRLAVKVGPVIKEVADESMASAIETLKEHKSKGKEIGFAVDGAYNNSRSQRHGVGNEPASQAYVTTTGHTADRSFKAVIGLKTISKLCLRCSRKETDHFLRTGEIVQIKDWVCDDCSRNIGPAETISREGEALKETVLEIKKKHNLEADYIVADGDTKISKVTKQLGIPRQKDPLHLTKAIKKKTPTPSAVKMNNIPGKNKDLRTKNWNLFKDGIGKRCNAENDKASKIAEKLKGPVKLNKVKSLLKKTPLAILACHSGKCGRLCKSHSLVCNGKGSGKGKYLDSFAPIFKLNKSQETIIKAMIEKRLVENIDFTYHYAGTNYNEGVNCAITHSLPKNKTFSKQMSARVNMAIVNVNEGKGKATIKVAEKLGDPLPLDAQEDLIKEDNLKLKGKEFRKTPEAKKRVGGRNMLLRKMYDEKKEKGGYKKHSDLQLDD